MIDHERTGDPAVRPTTVRLRRPTRSTRPTPASSDSRRAASAASASPALRRPTSPRSPPRSSPGVSPGTRRRRTCRVAAAAIQQPARRSQPRRRHPTRPGASRQYRARTSFEPLDGRRGPHRRRSCTARGARAPSSRSTPSSGLRAPTATPASRARRPAHRAARHSRSRSAKDGRRSARSFSPRPRPLRAGRVYRFALRGAAGQLLDTWAFQAQSAAPHRRHVPDTGAADVPIDTGIEVTFDQDGVTDAASTSRSSPRRRAASSSTAGRSRSSRTPAHTPATLYTVTVSRGVAVTGTGEATDGRHALPVRDGAKADAAEPADLRVPGRRVRVRTADRPIDRHVGLRLGEATARRRPSKHRRLSPGRPRCGDRAFRSIRTVPTWTTLVDDRPRRHDPADARLSPTCRFAPYAEQRCLRRRCRSASRRAGTSSSSRRTAAGPGRPPGHRRRRVPRRLRHEDPRLGERPRGRGARSRARPPSSDGTVRSGATARRPRRRAPPRRASCRRRRTPVRPSLRSGRDRPDRGRPRVFLPAASRRDKLEGYGELYWWSDADAQYLEPPPHRSQPLPPTRHRQPVGHGPRPRQRQGAVGASRSARRRRPRTADADGVAPVASRDQSAEPTGAFSGSLPLDRLPEGYYTIDLLVGEPRHPRPRSSRSARSPSRPTASMSTTGRRVYVAGDRIKVTVGAPLLRGHARPRRPAPASTASPSGTSTTDPLGTRDLADDRSSRARAGRPDLDRPVQAMPARAGGRRDQRRSRRLPRLPEQPDDRRPRPRSPAGRVRVPGTVHALDRRAARARDRRRQPIWDLDPRGAAVGGATVTGALHRADPRPRPQSGPTTTSSRRRSSRSTTIEIDQRGAGTSGARPRPTGPSRSRSRRRQPATTTGVLTRRRPRRPRDQRPSTPGSAIGSIGTRDAAAAPRRPGRRDGDRHFGVGDRDRPHDDRPGAPQTASDGRATCSSPPSAGSATPPSRPRRAMSPRFAELGRPEHAIGAVRFTGHGYVGRPASVRTSGQPDRRLEVELTRRRARYAPGDDGHGRRPDARRATGAPSPATRHPPGGRREAVLDRRRPRSTTR